MDKNKLREHPTEEWIAEIRERYPVEPTIDDTLTRKLRRRMADNKDATPTQEVGASLEAFLRTRIDGDIAVRNVKPLAGGASKEQFSFLLDWTRDDERRQGDRMVLRREPMESVVETNRLREFQLLRAGKTVAPVPTAHWLDESGDELGRPSLIYEFAEGVQKPTLGASGVTGMGIQFSADQRAEIGPQFLGILGRLHNFNPGGADLSAFSIPKTGTTEDIDWQINWWARVWQEDQFEAVPLLTLAEQWLRSHRQPLDHLSLVHSDFRTGNYLFNEESLQITAMLDWELGYFGDRHFDLAWALMPAFEVPAEDGSKLASSLYPRAQFISEYERISGLEVDDERLRYYTVLALWEATIMALGTAPRAAHGAKTHQDITLTWFAGLGYNLVESLRQALKDAT